MGSYRRTGTLNVRVFDYRVVLISENSEFGSWCLQSVQKTTPPRKISFVFAKITNFLLKLRTPYFVIRRCLIPSVKKMSKFNCGLNLKQYSNTSYLALMLATALLLKFSCFDFSARVFLLFCKLLESMLV